MSGHEYDYGDDFVEVRRGGQAGRAPYGAEHDLDRDLLLAGLRRERADSVTFTPQDSFGRTTHSEAGDSGDDQAYFSTKHQQFESSFRGIRRRERAPLAPRMWDMRRISGAEEPSAASDAPAGATYDSEVELRELPAEQQELAIIEDVLSLLIGVSGRYISFRHPAHAKVWRSPLAVDEALLAPMWISPTLAQMANKVLPLVLMHRRVEYFSSVYARREAGLVNQALCAAITSVLRDYHTSISTLENLERTSTATSPYTLQQLWYHLYPHMQTLERLMHLIDAIQAKDLPSATKAAASDDTPRESEGFTTAADRRMGAAPDAAHLPDGDGMAAPAPTRAERSGIGSNGAGPMSGDDADADSLAESDASDSEAEPSELFIVRGGHTLNIISDLIRLRGGDAAARQLYEFLLAKASVPFLQMLAYWLRTGELEDSRSAHPGGEFMVASDNGAAAGKSLVGAEASDDDLADESTIRPRLTGFVSVPELTPAFLRPYAEKIVRTGEYLNILRAYGVDLRALGGSDIQLPEAAAGLNSLQNPQALTRQIDEAYLRANQALLDVLFQGGQMMAYMGAVKRYLLFETSDFLTHFLDLAKVEITRQPKDMSSSRLQSFLDLALLNPASVSHDDPLRDIVRVTMESVDLVETMRVINTGHGGSANTSALLAARRLTREAAGATFLGTSIIGDDFLTGDLFMALQLQIPFPFTVVLDREALDKYTAMSRLLLALKQTEQALVTSWTLDLRLDDPPVEATGATGMDAKIAAARRALFLRIHTVRHRMVMAIQQILFYCFWDVIEPQWTRMIALMKAATTVDELCRIHKQHLDLMFQQCGLTAPKLPKITVELLMRASKFLSFVSKITTAKSALLRDTGSAAAQRTAAGRLRDDLVRDTADPETQYAQLLAAAKHADRLDRYWNEQLKVLLGALNHYARKFEESYLALAVRLDCYRGDDGATAR
ncbi:gamma tubulin complex Spc97/GCP2 subunit Alp4 [Coemansia helicoidea]|uniref:Gamma tubulin complex Spc97/GCP2 subunit Alp4 n=1 Tax=Coemansia helicoidea TaxID=1286919 RepID=A0ACC1LEZ6_9FUNG|nr:gamma tubulin complex Spc97/GCP2 subunit Alp4 [Coemansia helicoidea]